MSSFSLETSRSGHKGEAARRVLFLGAGASAAFGYAVTGQIIPRTTEGLVSRTVLPLESNPKRERAKMNRLREHLEALLPAVLEDDIELPLITVVLSLIDLLLSTGEVGRPHALHAGDRGLSSPTGGGDR